MRLKDADTHRLSKNITDPVERVKNSEVRRKARQST